MQGDWVGASFGVARGLEAVRKELIGAEGSGPISGFDALSLCIPKAHAAPKMGGRKRDKCHHPNAPVPAITLKGAMRIEMHTRSVSVKKRGWQRKTRATKP